MFHNAAASARQHEDSASSRTVASKKPRTPGSGLAKALTPSPELAAVVGAEPLPRTAVVFKLWDYIKVHELQDPADKREIIADDTLRPIFGADRVTISELAKVIGPHLTVV